MTSRICFITAIYGNYESSCKPFAPQTIPTDFICFTDNPNITANGWIIDTNPYHLTHPSSLDDGTMHNSLVNNKHTFNIAKYYKQAWQNIPRLANYDCVVWLDGTICICHSHTADYLLKNVAQHGIIGWHHFLRFGNLYSETKDSLFYRYTSNYWNGQYQPIQDVVGQYNAYIAEGYDENYWKTLNHHSQHIGVWITCFVAFNNRDLSVSDFLNLWYLQTLKYTTQDQISFSYVCQKTGLIPFTLPNAEVEGDDTNRRTSMYYKHEHGL